MNDKELKVEVKTDQKEFSLFTGAAIPPFKIRDGVKVYGTITVPLSHLEKITSTQIEYLNSDNPDCIQNLTPGDSNVVDESYLIVDRDKMFIEFVEYAGKDYQSSYKGVLKLNPDFEKFGINENESYTPLQLAQFIKMNRSYFESKTEAMKLVSTLMGFEAKVNKEVEAKADERANRRVLLAQTVTTNIPEGFKLDMPIFKGQPTSVFEVEIGIDPIDLSCRLISPEVNDIVNDVKNSIIDEQLDSISDLHTNLRIFEQ